ncbi:hypothetical protein [Lysobacter enzymogenes]|uniref:hypothetical protein n=1 Tax=Lysobacter enzymogenes TaxID=69 RepID=UPI00089D5016|nr:hypothetical protein [Lysobacter enzymogenes]SDX52105.1 hypothetical protein SAMN05421681_1065 [Lysobacter enzymogenes]
MTFLPNRIEAVPSAKPASDDVLRLCRDERDAFLVSVQLSGLTYQEIGARIGVSKQGVHKWREQGVPHRRTRAFCNATGTLLVIQFRELQKALRVAQNRVREADRIGYIASMQGAAA